MMATNICILISYLMGIRNGWIPHGLPAYRGAYGRMRKRSASTVFQSSHSSKNPSGQNFSRASIVNPRDLLRVARQLAAGALGRNRGRPRQTELRRAVSAAYYAIFHVLAACGANLLVGTTRAHRSQPAWRQTYRALEHRQAKNQCNIRQVMSRFPADIQAFGEQFVAMQVRRHEADYDPLATFSRSTVQQWIDETEKVIDLFQKTQRLDRCAFAVFVLFKLRR